jgi:dihydropteroate synthase
MYTLNCKGKLLIIDKPLVMGIINATPDSFFEGHLQKNINEIVDLAGSMLQAGAAIIDIGGQSTRPGSERISADEEIQRVVPVIKAIIYAHPTAIISIDTYHSEVAKAAVNAGACIVNDVSSGELDKEMIATVATLKVPYICMHMQGTPATMQQNPLYTDVTKEVLDFFIKKVADCREAGILDIIIDPGFGFGKTQAHNFTLLRQLGILKMLELPILVGVSRKGMVYKNLQITATEALNGSTVLHTIALMNGANIIRVHDVKEAREVVTLLHLYKNSATA